MQKRKKSPPNVLLGNCFAECACEQLVHCMCLWATAWPHVLVGNCMVTCACGQLLDQMCLCETASSWHPFKQSNAMPSVILVCFPKTHCVTQDEITWFHLIGQTYWESYSYSIVSISVLTHTGDFSAISWQEIIWSEKSKNAMIFLRSWWDFSMMQPISYDFFAE